MVVCIADVGYRVPWCACLTADLIAAAGVTGGLGGSLIPVWLRAWYDEQTRRARNDSKAEAVSESYARPVTTARPRPGICESRGSGTGRLTRAPMLCCSPLSTAQANSQPN
jgi:hypothetical protein